MGWKEAAVAYLEVLSRYLTGGFLLLLTSYQSDPGSIPYQVMWDLWWRMWHWGRFSHSISVSSANSHSINCSTIINCPVIDAT
jgi:hypothetical protein